MQITHKISDAENIQQGDILEGVTLFYADGENPETFAKHKGYCMVVSRPCNIANKGSVVVAPVVARTETLKISEDNAKNVKEALAILRDGLNAPDRFYIGQLNGIQGRCFVHFDVLFTIANDELERGVVARLDSEFVADLQLRIFMAFSKQGFSDTSWYSTPDLNWLISVFETEIASKKSSLTKDKAAGVNAKGYEKRQTEIERLVEQKRQFDSEMSRRGTT